MSVSNLLWFLAVWAGGMPFVFLLTSYLHHRKRWEQETCLGVTLFWPIALTVCVIFAPIALAFVGLHYFLEGVGSLYTASGHLWGRGPESYEESSPTEIDPEPSTEQTSDDDEQPCAPPEEELDPRINTKSPKRGLPN